MKKKGTHYLQPKHAVEFRIVSIRVADKNLYEKINKFHNQFIVI